jgi:hypothetical protein
VVYRDGLENRRGCKPSGGSNPSLSAMSDFRIESSFFINGLIFGLYTFSEGCTARIHFLFSKRLPSFQPAPSFPCSLPWYKVKLACYLPNLESR